jgi:hypothetical protein
MHTNCHHHSSCTHTSNRRHQLLRTLTTNLSSAAAGVGTLNLSYVRK